MVNALFDHEKLEVYQLSRELNRLLTVLLDELPRGHAEPKPAAGWTFDHAQHRGRRRKVEVA
jgi:hypothetical protein